MVWLITHDGLANQNSRIALSNDPVLNNKQLLDEVEHDIMNYQNRGIIHDIIRKPNSKIVLLYIFHIIHPQKQKRSVQPFCF